MTEPIKYAAFIVPELSKARLDEQWARIAEQRPGARKRPNATVPAFAILAAACALGVVWWPRDSRRASEAESVWEGSVVASDEAAVDMRLAEGTLIQVEPYSEVKLLHSSTEAVQVRLAHGSARFNVTKKRARRFGVNLGKVEVVVTGTQFRVTRRASPSGERVWVEVDEGSVEVHRGDGGVVALEAGERWSTVVSGAEHVEQTDPEAGGLDKPEEESEQRDAEEDASDEPALEDGSADERVEGEDAGERSSERGRARRARAHRRAHSGAGAAEELFDQANLARRSGRLEDAAELYEDVMVRHPRDRRASLAAFELGRLRMDSLRDVRGAVHALERALRLDARGAFAEDALARLVLAEEASGDREACARARARYLARYPDGVHAQHVAERCTNR